uniref:Tn3 family transposase n=1 Tax=Micromonospora echinaurantiaca TaxID=47857 RepID=UPI000B5AF29B|nr:Tn3 family transposase [Micromonospora echinaurantiaca]
MRIGQRAGRPTADALCVDLVEVDARTGFADHLVRASEKVNRTTELKRNVLYVIIAKATNMSLTEMASPAACL